MKINKSFLLLLMLPFSSVFLLGQSFLVHQYSETEGLPSANVYDITQDSLGRMWFATRDGIAVYDGVSWKAYTQSDSLPSMGYLKIKEDQKGKIWALPQTKGNNIEVIYHDIHSENNGNQKTPWIEINKPNTQFNQFTSLTSFQLLEQKQGDLPVIAVGTSDKGIFLWNPLNRGKWKHLTRANGLVNDQVNGIAALNGKFYVATEEGVSIITIQNNASPDIDNRLNQQLDHLTAKTIKGISIELSDLFPDFPLTHPRVWLFGDQWVGYFTESSFEITPYPVEILINDKKPTVSMLPDYCGGLYIGAHYELNYFNYKTRSWETIGVEKGLVGSGVNSLFIDSERNIWLACDRGVSKISSRCFSVFQRNHGLLEDEVSAVLEYEPGKFVLGHNFGFTLYDGKTFKGISYPREEKYGLAAMRILDIQADSRGNIWMASSLRGFAKVNPHSPHHITWYGEKNGLVGQVMCLWIDKSQKDRMWVGTVEGIFLPVQKEKTIEFVKMNTGQFPVISARKLYYEPGRKSLYVASQESGIYEYVQHKDQWRNYRAGDNKPANTVYAIKRDSRGQLLIGTLAGLFILQKGTLKKIKHKDFQVDRPVYFILEDQKNRLWIGTNSGVVRWDGKKPKKYSAARGLMGNETNRSAAIIDSKGKIWIGTNRSVSVYDEQYDTTDTYDPPPLLRLLHLEVSNQQIPLKPNTPVRLSYKDNTVVFHFRGISYLDEGAIRFQNKLEGFEKEWSKETYPYKQMIQYTNLSPGTYRFHLKARNSLRVWSEVVSSPPIIINPPFQQTWWFILLMVLLVGTIFYGVSRFFSQKKYAGLLEQEVEERTRQLKKAQQQLIQAQKMEAIGTLAGGIAHDFNNILGAIVGYTELALDDLPEGTPVRDNVRHVLTAAERAAELVKQILAFSRQSKQQRKPLNLSIIIKEAFKLMRSSLPATIEIRQDIRSHDGFILADPTQIHQVMINLCTNAAHAMRENGGIMGVELQEVYLDAETMPGKRDLKPGPYLKLTVSDTGHGMTPEIMKRIFEPYFTTKKTGEGTGMGLAVIHGIVKSYSGDISVYSEPGQGTAFHVFFPKIEKKDEPEIQAAQEIPGGRERIMLVDDEKTLAEMGTQILERLGYKVVAISNAVEALETFSKSPHQFHLVISDLTMPYMTGIQLAEEIKKINPDIPIIICSGFSADLTDEQLKALGISNFIMKPLAKNELAQIVRRVLDKRRT